MKNMQCYLTPACSEEGLRDPHLPPLENKQYQCVGFLADMLWAPPQNVDKQRFWVGSLNVFCNEDGGLTGKEAIFFIVTTFPCDNTMGPKPYRLRVSISLQNLVNKHCSTREITMMRPNWSQYLL